MTYEHGAQWRGGRVGLTRLLSRRCRSPAGSYARPARGCGCLVTARDTFTAWRAYRLRTRLLRAMLTVDIGEGGDVTS